MALAEIGLPQRVFFEQGIDYAPLAVRDLTQQGAETSCFLLFPIVAKILRDKVRKRVAEKRHRSG
jgi:hypothetical protein